MRGPLMEFKWKERRHPERHCKWFRQISLCMELTWTCQVEIKMERALKLGFRHRALRHRHPQRVFPSVGQSLREKCTFRSGASLNSTLKSFVISLPHPKTESYIFFLWAVSSWPLWVRFKEPKGVRAVTQFENHVKQGGSLLNAGKSKNLSQT